MSETVRSVLDVLKTSAYEVLAILLPGLALTHLVVRFFGVAIPANAIGVLIVAYMVGFAIQGLASLVFSVKWLRKRLRLPDAAGVPPTASTVPWKELHECAATLIRQKMDERIPEKAIFDICLTRIGSGRHVYDKFIALRDGARGLAAASVLAAILVAFHHGRAFGDSMRPLIEILVLLGAAILFCERHRRFANLGPHVVYSQFLAVHLEQQAAGAVPAKERVDAGPHL